MPKRSLHWGTVHSGTALWGTLVLLLLVSPCRAEDDGAPDLDNVIEQVLDAVDANDKKTLVRLARLEDPDPWEVAEMLCVDGEHDAAGDFAKAASKFKATKALRRYVRLRCKGTAKRRLLDTHNQVQDALDAENPKEALELTRKLPAAMPTVLHVLLRAGRGDAQEQLEQHDAAGASFAKAAVGARKFGWLGQAASLSMAAGKLLNVARSLRTARQETERALQGYAKLGAKAGAAEAHGQLGSIHVQSGNMPAAVEAFRAALALWSELERTARVAKMRLILGEVCQYIGAFPEALQHLEALRDSPEDLEDPGDRAAALNQLGYWHQRKGNTPRALEIIEKARAMAARLGETGVELSCCIDLGGIYAQAGDVRKSIEFNERARKLAEKIGDTSGAAHALSNVAAAYDMLGELDKALDYFEQALDLFADLEDFDGRAGEASTCASFALLLADMGDSKRALTFAKKAVTIARAADSVTHILEALESLAETQHRVGQHRAALKTAREARTSLRTMLTGLGEGETTFMRGDYVKIFRVGAKAAARIKDFKTAVSFIEEGRAMTLATSLGSYARDRVPPALLDEESTALSAVAKARAHLDALQTTEKPDTVKAERAVDLALDALRQVRDRIRKAGSAGEVVAPKATRLASLRKTLRPGQAFVYYLIDFREVVAIVIDGKGVRSHVLGDRDALEDGLAALHGPGGMRTRGRMLRMPTKAQKPPSIDPFATLRALLVEPLALGADVKEVVISPAGSVGYVPFGGLLKQPVTLVPSATTWLILRRAQKPRGKGVLALGNPDYAGSASKAGSAKTALPVQVRGETLSALPATEVEAKTVGDTVLLGPDANEKGLREQLVSRARWRSLHFACHGLLDPTRPRLSALALSRSTKEDDGLLSAVEIFALPLSADLAVLSACETGRGKVLRGEGIGGLTRAFMYAGVPRVICSLWKVDDEATRALMVKFYELWDPETGKGLGAAEALSKAQAHVRAQPRWKAPFYWAAWVLWGLPN